MDAPKINKGSEAIPQLTKTRFYPFESPHVSFSPEDPHQCHRNSIPSLAPSPAFPSLPAKQ